MGSSKTVLGLDIGGTNIRAGLLDEAGRLHRFEMTSSVQLFEEGRDAIAGLAAFIRDYCGRALAGKMPDAVSIGFPSTLNKEKTRLLSTPNLPGLNDLPVVEELGRALGVPVYINRDVNLLLICDMHAYQMDTAGVVIGCYIGTGLGNAISIGGEILSGKNGVAGELGHIPVAGCSRVCGCGNVGCMETLASGRYLAELRETQFPETPIGEMFTCHREDAALKDFVELLAIPVAVEINIFDPDCVILGGGVIQMQDFPVDALKAAILRHTRKPFPCENLVMKLSVQKQESGVIGAGMYAFDQMKKEK